jgi:predicted transcriptional regulator
MILKTKDIKSNLCKKGFVEDNKDHKFFYFSHNGKPSAIHTKFSHSANEVDDNLIHLMANQIHLTKSEFVKFVVCEINEQEYTEIQKGLGNLK